MSGRHTPGPWFSTDSKWNTGKMGGGYIRAESGPFVAACMHMNERRKMPFEANARLMAAAPDMLEALQGMIAYHSASIINDPTLHAKMEAARTAVARATLSPEPHQ